MRKKHLFPGAVVDHDVSCGQWTLEFREAGSLPPRRDIYIGWIIDICINEERGWHAASNTLKLPPCTWGWYIGIAPLFKRQKVQVGATSAATCFNLLIG